MSKIEIVLQGSGKEKAGRQRKSITVTGGRSEEKKKRVNWKGVK